MKRTIYHIIIALIFATGTSNAVPRPKVYIVVHGTWGANMTWHMPGGNFFDALEYSARKRNARVVSFMWSGSADHTSRMNAAHSLVKLIQSYPDSTRIHLVTHSHGSNVGMLTSQIMAQDRNNRHRIARFYALGTPVDMEHYEPDMSIIGYLYNMFSFADYVQPVLGMFGREFPYHERISNIRLTINYLEPRHTQLHHPLIAAWLPFVHKQYSQFLADYEVGNKPVIIHFLDKKLPEYEVDIYRKELVIDDIERIGKVRKRVKKAKQA